MEAASGTFSLPATRISSFFVSCRVACVRTKASNCSNDGHGASVYGVGKATCERVRRREDSAIRGSGGDGERDVVGLDAVDGSGGSVDVELVLRDDKVCRRTQRSEVSERISSRGWTLERTVLPRLRDVLTRRHSRVEPASRSTRLDTLDVDNPFGLEGVARVEDANVDGAERFRVVRVVGDLCETVEQFELVQGDRRGGVRKNVRIRRKRTRTARSERRSCRQAKARRACL